MKQNKGITLISIIIYVIVLSVVVGTVSGIMKYFYRNSNETSISSEAIDEYTRFLAYIAEDINSRKNSKR